MKKGRRNKGFSLVEVLIAIGVLAVGMMFVGGVFPVALYFTTVATERTVSSIVADEAFAKIQLIAENTQAKMTVVDPSKSLANEFKVGEPNDFNDVVSKVRTSLSLPSIEPNEFLYPSREEMGAQRQYCWSAICRKVRPNGKLVQVTVFVSRKVGAGTTYPTALGGISLRPIPLPVEVREIAGLPQQLTLNEGDTSTWPAEGYTVVHGSTGRIYRVVDRTDAILTLDKVWLPSIPPPPVEQIWYIPHPTSGGRKPCIAVYQKLIEF